MASNIYRQHLERNRANYAPLTPLSFLERSALTYPEKTAIIHGDRRFTYASFRERCHRLASSLRRRGIGEGDTVAIMAPNVPAMLEAHYGVPMIGAVLNCLNTRLDRSPAVIHIDDPLAGGAGRPMGEMDYESFIAEGDPGFAAPPPADEWT